jgi:hypothetical protein
LVKFMVVWYSLWWFGIFIPFWYVSTKKNLATLSSSSGHEFAPGVYFGAQE